MANSSNTLTAKLIFCLTFALMVLGTPVRSAFPQTFDFSADTFRTRLNARIVEDGGGQLKGCQKSRSSVKCTFDDKVFQQSVGMFKQLDLANGRFNLKQALEIAIKGDRVEKITLTGSRGDPMNLLAFSGTFGSVLGVFEPDLDAQSAANLVLELGLMRGDDAPTIGRQRTLFRKSVAVDCNQYPSAVSLKIECVFGPRY